MIPAPGVRNALVLVLLVVAATAIAPRRAAAVVPGLNADGSDLKRLTTNTFDEYSPVWSPDGTKIAFSSNLSGDYEIHVMDADGSNAMHGHR